MRIFSVSSLILFFSLAAAAQKAPEAVPARQLKKTPAIAVSTKTAAAQIPASDPAVERAKKVLAKLEAWDANLQTLKAVFTQEINFTEAGLKQSVEGSLQYVRPNFLRIEHSKPASQLVVTDKTDIWIYKPGDKQAVRTTWNAWRRTQDQNFSGILDFGNYSSLAANNTAAITEDNKDGLITLVLTPRSGNAYALTLRLSATDYFPVEAELNVDSTIVKTRLLKADRNSPLDKGIFNFSPPKGTEVLELKN
ncbi:MAG: hypothetical protein A2234_11570 [Elusimicrobia bacterium RIFOXYA2_FULL_58_8]|nr:MAG: hypothetical protein A2285_03795 [Elusimicrobia bacterium RIFOXYA12_FULL_57_11]OGS14280.1 MAG: hypothetical protein A2234_11570 [Elusimicrobia bacterium RIFOXYA2_FULL_58_8]